MLQELHYRVYDVTRVALHSLCCYKSCTTGFIMLQELHYRVYDVTRVALHSLCCYKVLILCSSVFQHENDGVHISHVSLVHAHLIPLLCA